MLDLTKKVWPLYSELINSISTCLIVSSLPTYSDHKPLQHIFAESRLIPTLASMCIQRWALILSTCIYDIQCKPTNTNVLNKYSLPEFPAAVPLPGETIFLWIPWKAPLLMP